MKISLLHPSRGRPQKSAQTTREWIDKAGCDTELLVSIDFSDPLRWEYQNHYGVHCLFKNENNSVVQATNIVAKQCTGDILLYLSDDFKCFENWGLAVLKEFEVESKPLLLKVDDCLQKFTVPVLTIPIMNRALYEKLGYFWHPEYKSMHVDVDLYYTVLQLGSIKYCQHLKFPHHHACNGMAPNDETYTRSAANWDQGLEVFNRRKKQGFPI